MNNITLRLNPQLEKFLSYISTNKSYTIINWNNEIEKLFDYTIKSSEAHLANNLSLYLFESKDYQEIYRYIMSIDNTSSRNKNIPLLKKTNNFLIGFQKISFYYQDSKDRELFETKNTLGNQIDNNFLSKYDIEVYETFKKKNKVSIHWLDNLNLIMFVFDKKKLIETTINSFTN